MPQLRLRARRDRERGARCVRSSRFTVWRRCARAAGVDEPRLLCSGPGRLCQALAVTDARTGCRSTGHRSSCATRGKRPELAVGPRIGLTKGGREPLALRPRRIALPEPAVQGRETLSTTRIPGVAARPGRGSCPTTRPLMPPSSAARSFSCASLARALATFIPTSFGTTPYTARETTSLTFWYAESVPSVGFWPTTIPGSLPGFRRRVDDGREERLADQARLRVLERRAPDVGHLDLVRLARRGRARLGAREELERRRAAAVAVVELQLPVAEDHLRRGGVRDVRGSERRVLVGAVRDAPSP